MTHPASLPTTTVKGPVIEASISPQPAITFLSVVEMMLRRPRLIVGLPLLAALTIGTIGLLSHRAYTASTQFVPQSSDLSASKMAGLAAQFGVAVPGIGGGQSPDMYAALIVSRSSLAALVDSTYRFQADGKTYSGTLVSLYNTTGNTPADAREKAIKKLERDVSVDIGLKSGVISVKVRARWPALAQQLCERILAYVNAQNLATRQARARAEQQFYEERLRESEAEVRVGENALESFLAQNRNGMNAPRLSREEERLRRVISMRQQVFTSLMQAREQASMDAAHNTPVISLVDPPNLPYRPDSRLLAIKVVLGGLGALLLACVIGLALDAVARTRRDDPITFARLSALRQEAFSRLFFRRRAV